MLNTDPFTERQKNTIVCRCEEISEAEIRAAIRAGYTSVIEIKRRTRAGMGLCQGRSCESIIQNLIAAETGRSKTEIGSDTSRFPIYPVNLTALEGMHKE